MSRPSDEAIAAAWYSPQKLAEMAREREEEAAFRRMLRRRNRFEETVRSAGHPLTDEELKKAWQQADMEAQEDTDGSRH